MLDKHIQIQLQIYDKNLVSAKIKSQKAHTCTHTNNPS